MVSNWKIVQLNSVCSKIGSGATPRGGKEVYLTNGIPLIRSQNVYNDGFRRDGLAFITDYHADELSNVEVQENDILLNITGDSVARVCLVPNKILPARVNQHVALIRSKPSILNPKFLRYFLTSPEMQNQMLALASAGATRNALTKQMIENFSVPVPSLPEQEAIAHILSSLDDKIELNRRMNETLEQMARAIFKSWFVDFDPVHAKSQGKKPVGMDTETAALFPNSFQDSPLGKIPKGWTLTTLENLCDYIIGGDWGNETQDNVFVQPCYCIRGADIPDLQNSRIGKTPIRYLREENLKKRRLQTDDLVFEISGGSPTQQTGRVIYITQDFLKQLPLPLVCSNFCRLVRTKKTVPSVFIYFWLRWLYSIDSFWQYENGTTGIKNFAFTVFNSTHELVLPPTNILRRFVEITKDLLQQKDAVGAESVTLEGIRDALLPRLLSGEIQIKDTKNFIKEVV